MITGVGSSSFLPSSNTSFGDKSGKATVLSEIEAEAENISTQIQATKDVSPISPEGFNTLLEAQSDDNTDAEGLTEEEQKQVEELKEIDRETRAHEQAHKSAAGPYAGAISYTTETGPDGRQYAVAGEVQIDASPIPGNPAATIRKMEIVARAALAPSEPSPQDTQVARQAQQQRIKATQELREQEEQERAELKEKNGDPLTSDPESVKQSEAKDTASIEDPAEQIVSILFGS